MNFNHSTSTDSIWETFEDFYKRQGSELAKKKRWKPRLDFSHNPTGQPTISFPTAEVKSPYPWDPTVIKIRLEVGHYV